MLLNFGTDRDISKMRKVLNPAKYKEKAIEVSRKSVIFSFFVVKELTDAIYENLTIFAFNSLTKFYGFN